MNSALAVIPNLLLIFCHIYKLSICAPQVLCSIQMAKYRITQTITITQRLSITYCPNSMMPFPNQDAKCSRPGQTNVCVTAQMQPYATITVATCLLTLSYNSSDRVTEQLLTNRKPRHLHKSHTQDCKTVSGNMQLHTQHYCRYQ